MKFISFNGIVSKNELKKINLLKIKNIMAVFIFLCFNNIKRTLINDHT